MAQNISLALVAGSNHKALQSLVHTSDKYSNASHIFDCDVGYGGADDDAIFPPFVGIYPPQLRSMFVVYELVENVRLINLVFR